MDKQAVWVIEYFDDGVWTPYNVFTHMDAASQALHARRKNAMDPGHWRRKKYVRDTSTPVAKGPLR